MSNEINNHKALAEKRFEGEHVYMCQGAVYVRDYGMFDLLEKELYTKQPTVRSERSAFKVLMMPLVFKRINQLAQESGSWTTLTPEYVYEVACDVFGLEA